MANTGAAPACVFCAALQGDDLVHVDENTAVLLDIRPVFKGHLLVIPTSHIVTLDALPTAELTPLFSVVQACMRAVKAELGAHGSFVASNNEVSQSVAHLHVHVVPRRRKDGLRGFFWPRETYEPGEIETYRERLRDALAAELTA